MTSGDEHTCVIREDHTAWCWGRNTSGQLGDGTTDVRGAPVQVVGATKFAAIAAGGSHTCAVADDHRAWCWGNNNAGQLGTGIASTSPQPMPVAGLTSVTALAAGRAHTCALLDGGLVRCWGEDQDDGGVLLGVKELVAGGPISCAITGDGALACWGDDPPELFPLPDGSPVAHVALGVDFLCALSTGGDVYCRGSNEDGQLGTPGPASNDAFVRVPLRVRATAIFAGGQFACIVPDGGDDRNLWCWGEDADQQLADGTDRDHPSPFLSSYAAPVDADGGLYHMCALSSRGAVTCSGFNGRGQLGDGHPTMQGKPPPAIAGLGGVTSIATGLDHSCAVAAGAVWCWGQNDFGQLGDGTLLDRSTPVRVFGVERAVAVAAGEKHSCALLDDATAMCWGSDTNGQLSNGEAPSTSHFQGALAQPVLDGQGNVLRGITQLALGSALTCAVVGGGVLCWGSNSEGEAGQPVMPGRNIYVPTAVPFPPATSVREITAGDSHVCAVINDATVMCWGENGSGQLGNGDPANHDDSSTPVAVKMLTGVEHIRSFRHHTCALANTKVSCWGEGEFGALGTDSPADRFTPGMPVSLPPTPTLITAGGEHSCALTSAGLFCWGSNSTGQLGDGSFDRHFTPVSAAVPTGAKIIALSGGDEHTCAVLEGGTVTCWGLDNHGQLGDGGYERPGRVAPVLPCP